MGQANKSFGLLLLRYLHGHAPAGSPRVKRHTRLEALDHPFKLLRDRYLLVESEQLQKQRKKEKQEA